MFMLVNFVVSVVLAILSFGTLETIYGLAIFLPSIGVSFRRLHDTDRSGLWLLLGLIPIIGALVLLYFFAQDSAPGTNQYGPNPKSDVLMPSMRRSTSKKDSNMLFESFLLFL